MSKNDPTYDYMCLGRMQMDCEAFIDQPQNEHLMMLTVEGQLAAMKELYARVPEPPEFMSVEDIAQYEEEMTNIVLNSEKRNGLI